MYVYVWNIAVSALHEIKHKAHSQDANKARGEAECLHWGHMLSALFHVKYKQGNALTI